MTPDFQTPDGRVTLYCADCLDVLPTLAAGSVDAVVADIPYAEVNRESGGLRNLDKGMADIETFPLEFAAEQAARLANGSVYLWCGIEQVSELKSLFVGLGMTVRLCIWEKRNPSPMNGDKFWLSSIECCVFARKSNAFFGHTCKSPVWRLPVERDQVHPAQKPIDLLGILISASTVRDGSALDFCMGSGSTGVAAVKLGRRFIGIEKEPAYFAIAKARIQHAIEDKMNELPMEIES